MGVLAGGLGNLIGGSIGEKYGGSSGKALGSAIGTFAGGLVPWFKNGGKVNKTGPAVIHKGEYVLPANAKPTKAQKAIVAKNKAKARKAK